MAKVETAVVLRFHNTEEADLVKKALTHLNKNRLNEQERTTRDHMIEVLDKVNQNLLQIEEITLDENIEAPPYDLVKEGHDPNTTKEMNDGTNK